MCGFAVVVSLDGEPLGSHVIQRMTDAIRHRGPDDEGITVSGPVAMGFRRLSILDLSPLGHQPMQTAGGEAVVVFNGEIYNYLELREELESRGHVFRSTGDTEVLLHAYLEWGADCIERFNGMWAFVLFDRRTSTLFGSRDRFGIKPLYRFRGPKHVVLASEIKAIRASGLCDSSTNWSTAARFLLEGRLDDTRETFYQNIDRILPGTSFALNLRGDLRERRYWSIESLPGVDVEKPPVAFADLFEDAVRLHMRSDVPVGVHLSGGLDSTSILCAASRLRQKANASSPLMGFSYIDTGFDESRYIADTIEQTRATLVRLQTDPHRLWSILGEVLRFQDEPIYSMMPLVVYELMRLTANNGIKVILNGQGADETLAGYPSYFREYWATLLSEGRVTEAWREIGRHARCHGGNRHRDFLGTARHLAQSRGAALAPYRRLASWRRHRRHLRSRWYTPSLGKHLAPEAHDMTSANLNASLAYSVNHIPLQQILRIEDRNSMAHSIESRLPFLDYRLVSLAFGLAPEWHMRGPWNKYVLREAMRGRIPESVRSRIDKMGFPVPARDWLADALHEPLMDVLHSRKLRERGIYDVDAILRDAASHRARKLDATAAMFNVAQFETWAEL